MHWSDIPFQPPAKTVRDFAVLCCLLLGGLGLWQLLAGREMLAALLAGLALLLAVAGLLLPAAVRPVYVGLMILTFPLSWLLTRLVLALVFSCLFTPLGLLFRLFGRDVLGLRFRPNQETYWAAKPGADNVRRYFRPY